MFLVSFLILAILMNLYQKHILPKLLNFTMQRSEMEKHRPDIVGQASGVVLEVGFGSGLNLPYYKNVSKLYALDPSRELYDIAKDRVEKALFTTEHLEASAENIPLASGTIDCVVSTWSLCSIPNPEIALGEIFRVLKSGGRFMFIEHGKSPIIFVGKIQKLFTPISKCVAGGCHMDRDIEKMIKNAGFEIQKLEKFQQKFKPLAFMYKGVAAVKK